MEEFRVPLRTISVCQLGQQSPIAISVLGPVYPEHEPSLKD
jgi:hypothetical protein